MHSPRPWWAGYTLQPTRTLANAMHSHTPTAQLFVSGGMKGGGRTRAGFNFKGGVQVLKGFSLVGQVRHAISAMRLRWLVGVPKRTRELQHLLPRGTTWGLRPRIMGVLKVGSAGIAAPVPRAHKFWAWGWMELGMEKREGALSKALHTQ